MIMGTGRPSSNDEDKLQFPYSIFVRITRKT